MGSIRSTVPSSCENVYTELDPGNLRVGLGPGCLGVTVVRNFQASELAK